MGKALNVYFSGEEKEVDNNVLFWAISLEIREKYKLKPSDQIPYTQIVRILIITNVTENAQQEFHFGR